MPGVSGRCPDNPPPPEGYTFLHAVPPEVRAWAVMLLSHVRAFPMFTVWGWPIDETRVLLARSEWHTWSHDPTGRRVDGLCIPGITVYEPTS